jgi:hypothetical protein
VTLLLPSAISKLTSDDPDDRAAGMKYLLDASQSQANMSEFLCEAALMEPLLTQLAQLQVPEGFVLVERMLGRASAGAVERMIEAGLSELLCIGLAGSAQVAASRCLSKVGDIDPFLLLLFCGRGGVKAISDFMAEADRSVAAEVRVWGILSILGYWTGRWPARSVGVPCDADVLAAVSTSWIDLEVLGGWIRGARGVAISAMLGALGFSLRPAVVDFLTSPAMMLLSPDLDSPGLLDLCSMSLRLAPAALGLAKKLVFAGVPREWAAACFEMVSRVISRAREGFEWRHTLAPAAEVMLAIFDKHTRRWAFEASRRPWWGWLCGTLADGPTEERRASCEMLIVLAATVRKQVVDEELMETVVEFLGTLPGGDLWYWFELLKCTFERGSEMHDESARWWFVGSGGLEAIEERLRLGIDDPRAAAAARLLLGMCGSE